MTTNNAINAPFPISTTQGGSGVVSPTAHGILIAEGTSPFTPIVLAAGQILIGTTAGDPAATTLTSGTGVSITSVSGVITISANGEMPWVDQTSGSVTMLAGTGYVTDNGASLVTYTIPATAALGDVFEVVGKSSGGWEVQANTGQIINFGNTPTSSAGSISSTNQYDTIKFVCVAANTTFVVRGAIGNLTVV